MKEIIILSGLLLSLSVTAQNSLKEKGLTREVEIEKEYSPLIRQAVKTNMLPEVVAQPVEKSPISYALEAVPTDIVSPIKTLPVSGYDTQSTFRPRRGYAGIEAGNYWNLRAYIGYRLIDNERHRLTVEARHNSFSGNMNNLHEQQKEFRQEATEKVSANYLFAINKKSRLKASAFYQFDGLRYYGLGALSPAQTPHFTEGDRQSIHQFGEKLSFSSAWGDEFLYHASLQHGYYKANDVFNLLPENRGIGAENHITSLIGMSGNIQNYKLMMDVQLDNLLYGQNKGNNYSMITFNPSISNRWEHVSAKVGVTANVSINQGTLVRFSPIVEASFFITENYLIKANISGGKVINSFARLSSTLTPYLSPYTRPADSYKPIDATLSFTATPFAHFSVDIFGGFCRTIDEVYALRRGIIPVVSLATTDNNTFQYGLTAKYALPNRWEADLALTKYHYSNTPFDNFIPYKASFEASISGLYHITSRWRVGAQYKTTIGRKYFNEITFDSSPIRYEIGSLRDIHLVNLSGGYAFRDNIDFTLSINNLLAQRYELFYGMREQGFNVMVGASIRF